MNIAIIEPNQILRDSLRVLLEQVCDFQVVFDSGCIEDFFKYIDVRLVNVVLLDEDRGTENLPGDIQKSRILSSGIKIIILSDPEAHYYLKNYLKYEVEGILLKNSTKQEFENKIRSTNN